MRLLKRWLPLGLTTTAALALWAVAAAHGYGWEMVWLPAAVAGAAWPTDRRRTLHQCVRRLRRRHDRGARPFARY
jgi:hypothetical protein